MPRSILQSGYVGVFMWLAALLAAAKTASAAAAEQQNGQKTIHAATAKTAITALF